MIVVHLAGILVRHAKDEMNAARKVGRPWHRHLSVLAQQSGCAARRGAVVSGVRRMNEVNARRARLVPGWVTVFGRVCTSRYVTSRLGQLSLASLRGRLIEYQLRLG